MLLLLFHAGDHAFALDASRILRVSPAPELRPVPHAPAYVAGLVNYGGRAVPALDLTRLLAQRASRPVLSTRLLLVRWAAGEETGVLGLIAERVVETVSCKETDFMPAGVYPPDAPYLGKILILNGRIVQQVSVDDLLGEEARALLTPAAE